MRFRPIMLFGLCAAATASVVTKAFFEGTVVKSDEVRLLLFLL